jgi:CRP-like cAMP-binding protein
MTTDSPEAHCSLELLAKRLSTCVTLSAREQELLLRKTRFFTTYQAGSTVPMPKERGLRPIVIASGWACRERITHSGRRQILSILLPGDVIWGRGDDCAIDLLETVAITRLRVVSLASAMRSLDRDPASFATLNQGLEMLQLGEAKDLVDHAARLGARADQRIAGLILHLFKRCRAISFVTGRSFVMPLKQPCLGSLAGLSNIHVNRVLRQFKAEGVLRLKAGIVEILDWSRLASIEEGARPDEWRSAGSRRHSGELESAISAA